MKVIKINSLWCPACLIMNNLLDKVKDKYALDIIDYDYDEDHEKIKIYNIGKILPVIIFLDNNNKEIKRIIGELKIKELTKILDNLERGF
ncbi:MAG: hypothetical protein GX861_00680 [Tenericutes bacterium]|nr:hypothetical protein [Mycoplasmatota bacterium]